MVPIILTGDSSAESVILTMRAGAFDYLTKPVASANLRAAIVRALAHHDAVCERAALMQLLFEEREQLKAKIEVATADIRQYAASCEASNARLQSLLRMSQTSTELYTDDGLLRRAFEEASAHVPVRCLALCDAVDKQFLAVYRDEEDAVRVVVSGGQESDQLLDSLMAADSKLMVQTCTERHTSIETSLLQTFVYPQIFWNRPVCTVGIYLTPEFEVRDKDEEFLGMCAFCIASEWQQARLLQDAAQRASLGNIALELSKNFLQCLTAIRTAADFVAETTGSQEVHEGLAIIIDNAVLLRRQIREFRDLAMQRKDSIETVRLDEYIDKALLMLSVAIRNSGVRVERDYRATGECVLLNGADLARTFLDLISSAVRTVGSGGKILLRLLDAGADHVFFEIAYTRGNGRAAVRSKETGLSAPQDLGHGHPSFLLALRVVHGCGGKLTLEKDGEIGSMFRIMLPRNASQRGHALEAVP
jgi:hypothetical protein